MKIGAWYECFHGLLGVSQAKKMIKIMIKNSAITYLDRLQMLTVNISSG